MHKIFSSTKDRFIKDEYGMQFLCISKGPTELYYTFKDLQVLPHRILSLTLDCVSDYAKTEDEKKKVDVLQRFLDEGIKK